MQSLTGYLSTITEAHILRHVGSFLLNMQMHFDLVMSHHETSAVTSQIVHSRLSHYENGTPWFTV